MVQKDRVHFHKKTNMAKHWETEPKLIATHFGRKKKGWSGESNTKMGNSKYIPCRNTVVTFLLKEPGVQEQGNGIADS